MKPKSVATCLLSYILAICLIKMLFMRWAVFPVPVVESPISPIPSIVHKLAICESGLNPHAIHLNDGRIGLHSRGILQFQRPTFESYWRALVNPDVEPSDIDNLYLDAETQKWLAIKMLQADFNNWHNWENCGRKIGLAKLSTAILTKR